MNDDNGLLELPCRGTFAEVLARLDGFFARAGLRVFARIDQAAAARDVGLSLRPTVLVLFGSPAAGTPLMDRHPALALDLPLRVLVVERSPGDVVLLTNAPEFFQRRHGLDAPPFAPVIAALRDVAAGASTP